MIKKKKTMYEILDVLPNASYAEIKEAHQRLSDKLQLNESGLSPEDLDFQLKLLKVAFHTLSTPMSRDAYDAQLAPPSPANIAVPTSVVALKPHVEAMALRADAMSLRAEAMSLKADALSLRADALPIKAAGDHSATMFEFFNNLARPVKRILLIFGTLIAIGMVIQVLFLMFADPSVGYGSAEAAKAEEKVIIQEYYQEHGVRPASKIEAELLEVENRRRENEQRAADREKQRADEEYRRFVEDSRRSGEQVSAELRHAEAEARRDEEQKRMQLEEQKRQEEEAEIERIERERARWRNDLYQSPR